MTAYELADELLRDNTQLTVKAAVLLRQQADRIAELEKVIQDGIKAFGAIQDQQLKNKFETPQTKPLSDDEIWNWFKENTALTKESALRIARAIEERHGIK